MLSYQLIDSQAQGNRITDENTSIISKKLILIVLMRKLLVILFIASIILLCMDRLAAHLYVPKENSRGVVIYTTQWCPYCKALRGTLDQYKIPYIERDTEKSLSGFAGYWALKGRGVPVSVIGSEIIHGYDGQIITDTLVSAGFTIPPDWPDDELQ